MPFLFQKRLVDSTSVVKKRQCHSYVGGSNVWSFKHFNDWRISDFSLTQYTSEKLFGKFLLRSNLQLLLYVIKRLSCVVNFCVLFRTGCLPEFGTKIFYMRSDWFTQLVCYRYIDHFCVASSCSSRTVFFANIFCCFL